VSTAEGYSIDAYCDECGDVQQFFGPTKRAAEREARSAQWIVSQRKRAPEKSVAGGRAVRCRLCITKSLKLAASDTQETPNG
jgi:hypothetical protein